MAYVFQIKTEFLALPEVRWPASGLRRTASCAQAIRWPASASGLRRTASWPSKLEILNLFLLARCFACSESKIQNCFVFK